MADVKIEYGASLTLTIALASLATSSSRTAGMESTAINNSSNKYLDYLVGGKITTGGGPTDGKQIDIWVYATVNDTPLYPDVLDGTGSQETITSSSVLNSGLVLARIIGTTSSGNVTYWCAPFSVASLFGGRCPQRWGLWIAHDTGVALHSSSANHAFYATPVYETVL